MEENWLATTQYKSWLEHARRLVDSEKAADVYAAYLMAYIGLILFCREQYEMPLGEEQLPVHDGHGLVRDYGPLFDKLPNNSEAKLFAKEVSLFLDDRPLTYYSGTEQHTMHFKGDDFMSVLHFLRNVRNNMVHGQKDFEIRNQVIVTAAYALLMALFNEVFTPPSH